MVSLNCPKVLKVLWDLPLYYITRMNIYFKASDMYNLVDGFNNCFIQDYGVPFIELILGSKQYYSFFRSYSFL